MSKTEFPTGTLTLSSWLEILICPTASPKQRQLLRKHETSRVALPKDLVVGLLDAESTRTIFELTSTLWLILIGIKMEFVENGDLDLVLVTTGW